MEMFKRYFFILFLVNTLNGRTQDVHFSQYYNIPQMINPALIGDGQMRSRLILNFRNQSSFTPNPYKTLSFSGETKLKNESFSCGIIFLHDKSGVSDYSTNEFCASGVNSIQLTKQHSIKFAFQGGWTQYAVDENNLSWNSQFDGSKINTSIPSGEPIRKGFGYFDLSTGMVWKYQMTNKNEIKTGISAFHITHPLYNVFTAKKLDIRWCIYNEACILIKNTNIRILPSVLFMKQGSANEVDIGTSAKCKIGVNKRYTPDKIASYAYFGCYYRSNDAIMLLTGISFQEQMIVSISYDITSSQLSKVQKDSGSIEFSVAYIIQN
jgi:type IX secretion system PorP/SprF family membrane protein